MSSEIRQRVGSVIEGRYEVERLIAKGGFSSVYRARRLEDDVAVGVKILELGADVQANWIERFTREAQVVSQLQSPNTVRILDWGQVGTEYLYTVMEYIAGRSLFRQIRKHGALNTRQVAEVTVQMCNSLEEAHAAGFLHRDLKPSNVMLFRDDTGRVVVKVLDFGVAKILDPGPEFDLQLTQEGTFVGTPRYAAPEQLRREPLTPACDVYGVGMIMWEALVGDPAVPDREYSACVSTHLSGEPWQLPDWVGCPTDFAAIVEKALAKPVHQRYQSCAELQVALRQWLMSGARGHRSPAQGSRLHAASHDATDEQTRGDNAVAKKETYNPETLEDVEAEDELFGEMVEQSDAHIEDVNVMHRSDLSEASDAASRGTSIPLVERRKSNHAGIDVEDRAVARAPDDDSQSSVVLTVVLVAALVIGGLYVLTMGEESEPKPSDEVTTPAVGDGESAAKPAAKEPRAPVASDDERGDGTPTLDADTIVKGMVASGWRVGSSTTATMDEVKQTTLAATKDQLGASITIYESETWEWADELRKTTEEPVEAIAFGRTIVRVASGANDKLNGSAEMSKTLWEFKKYARDRLGQKAEEEATPGDENTTQ